MKFIVLLKQNIWLLFIMLLGAVLRFNHPDFQSIWLDEIFSMIHANPDKSFMEIYAFIKAYDPHPPLYYFLLHVFLKIFGYTTLNARIFSAIIGIVGIYYLYLLAKELFNKRIGLIAGLLLAVNYFHIYYSQEIRMYTLLFLGATISFYYMVRFIKKPTVKSSIAFGFAAALLIYAQFFGLFTLASQYLILLYFIIKPYSVTRVKFLSYSALASVITLVVYIPAIPIFIQTSKMQSNWILPPGPDAFANLFKEFFGFAEIVVWMAMLGVILYFTASVKKENKQELAINPKEDKYTFSVLVVSSWIFISILIPLVLSYLKLPMIINRYFICILPAVIIIVAAGIGAIKSGAVQIVVLSCFILFSVTDLFFVKNYYKKPTKTEFREITEKIKERNVRGSKIVTYWGWLIPYFFEDTPQMKVLGSGLSEYIIAMQGGIKPVEPFWYIDGNSRPFNPTPEEQEYLNQNFVLKEKLEYLDTWAHYYMPKSAESQLVMPNMDAPVVPKLYKKGDYNLVIDAGTLPLKVHEENPACIKVKFNGRMIGKFSLKQEDKTVYNIPFTLNEDEKGVIQLFYVDRRFEYAYSRYTSIYLTKIINKGN